MNWFTGIMVYIIVWWMVLLMVLPLWIRRPEQVERAMTQAPRPRP